MKNYFLGSIFFLLICCQSVYAQLGFNNQLDTKKVVIKFGLYSNLIVVPLILNQRLPLKFILDTGVQNAILTEKVYTDILNIPYSRKFVIRGVGGENIVDAYLANSITLALPGITGKGHTLLVLAEDLIELRNFLGTEVHGMFGYELFSKFVVEINYSQKLLTLHRPDRFKAPSRFREFDITVEDTKPFIELPILFEDGTEIIAKLLIDTGASHSLLLHPEASDSIIIPSKTLDAHIGRGLGGDVEGRIGRIKEIKFGDDYHFEDAITTFPYPNSYLDSLLSPQIFRHGSIGGGLLSRFNVIFDYPNNKLYLKKNSSYRKPFYYNLSGVTVKAIGAKLTDYEIEEVRLASNAYENGLRKGDRILAINNIPVKELNFNQINGYLNRKPNKRVSMVISRDNKRKKIVFKLKSAI